MTPQERQLIDDLFDRLAKLENAPRDPEAMSAIMQGLRNAPNAIYALVQTALVQDEALKRANDHIQALEAGQMGEQNQSGGFLDSMRDAIFGQNQSRGSVPPVRAPDMGSRPVWNSGQTLQQPQSPGYGQPPYGQPSGPPQPPFGGGGGSFLGTAAAAAAGVVGGSLLLGSIRNMMGGGSHQSLADAGSFGNHAAKLAFLGDGPAATWRETRDQRHRFVRPARRRQFRFARRFLRPGRRTTTITTWTTIQTELFDDGGGDSDYA